jgi:hypothetical protein
MMVKKLFILEEQVSKKVTHFRGQIPVGSISCPLGVGSERSKPQNNPAFIPSCGSASLPWRLRSDLPDRNLILVHRNPISARRK